MCYSHILTQEELYHRMFLTWSWGNCISRFCHRYSFFLLLVRFFMHPCPENVDEFFILVLIQISDFRQSKSETSAVNASSDIQFYVTIGWNRSSMLWLLMQIGQVRRPIRLRIWFGWCLFSARLYLPLFSSPGLVGKGPWPVAYFVIHRTPPCPPNKDA